MENRLINYWKNGKWFQGVDPNAEIIEIAEPEKAQKALDASSDAFDLSIKTEPETIDDVVDTSLSDNYTKELQGYGLSTGNLSDLQEIINSWGESTADERSTKKRAQKALQNLSSSGVSFYENPYLKTSSAEQLADIRANQQKRDEQYQGDKSLLQQQIDSANRADEFGYQRSVEKGEGATGAMTAKYSSGREGVGSTTNPMLATEFSSVVQEQLSVTRQQLDSAQATRANLMTQLEEAKKNNDEKAASAISTSLADVGNQIMKIQQEADTQQAKNSAEAFERISKLSALSKDAGGGIFTGWTPQDIASTFGVDIGTAATVANIDARIASTDTSAIDYDQKVANLKKTQQDILKSGLPLSAQEFMYYQELYKTDPVSAEKYAKRIGMDDNIIGEWTTTESKKVNDSIDFFNETNVAVPVNSKYNFSASGNSITWDVPIGQPPSQSRWECGEFANDALGKPNLFRNSLTEKRQVANSEKPVAGGAVVFDVGDTIGHVGLVEEVFDTGYTVRDSNRLKNEKGQGIIDTMFVPFGSKWDNMNAGFYNPYQGANNISNLQPELSKRLDVALQGQTSSKAKDSRASIASALKNGDTETVESIINDIEIDKWGDRVKDAVTVFNSDIKDYKDVKDKDRKISQVWEQYQAGNASPVVVDQAIISLFNKITDPSSVVRESEFERTGQSLGIWDRVSALPQKIKEGGAGLTDKNREDLVSISKALTRGAEGKLVDARNTAINKTSSQNVPDYFTYSQLGLNSKGEYGVIEEASEETLQSLWGTSEEVADLTWEDVLKQQDNQ